MSLNFELAPKSLEELKELLRNSLLRGRAFVTKVETLPSYEQATRRESCTLVVVEPTQRSSVKLEAELVFVQEEAAGRGVGLELRKDNLVSALQALVTACEETIPTREGGKGSEDSAKVGANEIEELNAEEVEAPPKDVKKKLLRNIHDRIRSLSSAERDRMARTGILSERVALERAYGSSVWDALLQNPQLSGGELSRIAKNGTAPTPILAIIANNSGWISRGEVRRGLLSNPRLGAALIERVLRACPKNELKLVATQAMYPARVRSVATKIAKPGN